MAQLKATYRAGVAATELAILLPLIILLCLAVVDLSRFGHAAIVLENAVRVGAEYGAGRAVTEFTYDTWEDQIEQQVLEDVGEEHALDVPTVSVDLSSFSTEFPRVVVTGEYTFETVFSWWMLPDELVIRRTSSMQRYR